MARKKTLEEQRAGNRERQRRWRKAHRWLGEQRRLALYGKSEAQKKLACEDPVTHNETPKPANVPGELHYGLVEGYDRMEPNWRGGHGGFKNMGQEDELGVGGADAGGRVTEEEVERTRAALGRLEELKARQAEGRLNAGVEVELEV
jgi:hypothetical protein